MKIKDRSKDIIISGGENISSLEVEDVLFRHPAVLGAAVVAQPDEKWGETPCAFVELKPGATVSAEALTVLPRALGGVQGAEAILVFCELPKTSTGKILQKFVCGSKRGRSKRSRHDHAPACAPVHARDRRAKSTLGGGRLEHAGAGAGGAPAYTEDSPVSGAFPRGELDPAMRTRRRACRATLSAARTRCR